MPRPSQGPGGFLPCSETGVFLEKCLRPVWCHYILHCVYLAFQNSTFAVRGKDKKPGEAWKWAALPRRPWEEGRARSTGASPRPRGEFQLRMSVKSDFQAWVCLDVYENKMLVALKPLERGGRARGQKCCQHCLLRRSQRNRLHWALSSEGCARKNRAWYPGTRDAWASDASPGPRRFQCEHTCLSKHVCRVCAQIRGMKIWKSHN